MKHFLAIIILFLGVQVTYAQTSLKVKTQLVNVEGAIIGSERLASVPTSALPDPSSRLGG